MGARRWWAVVVLAMVAATCGAGRAAAAPEPAPAQLVTIDIPAVHAQLPPQWLNYGGPPRANVLLPAGYDPHQQYPLLVLLHGLGGNYAWYAQTGLVDLFDDLGAIVVMPEGGPGGWYADWWDFGDRQSPAWETYELDDVLPTILARYPIRPERQYHAIAGISMGGLGATYLGGRLPGFFGTVATLSGWVNPQLLAPVIQPAMGIVSNAGLNGRDAFFPVYGRPYGYYSDGHNPSRLAANLRQTRVYETTGTGIPTAAGVGLLLGGAGLELVNGIWEEVLILLMSARYHAALQAAGVDVTYQVHNGGHDLPAFIDEIGALLDWGLFEPVATAPTAWTNDTVATGGQLWDVGYRFDSPPTALVRFQRSGARLSIGAAGSAVTLTVAGCVLHVPTPTLVDLSHPCEHPGP